MEQIKRASVKIARYGQKAELSDDEILRISYELSGGLDWEKETNLLVTALMPAWVISFEQGLEFANIQMGLTGDTQLVYSVFDDRFTPYINQYGTMQVKRINDTTREYIRGQIQLGLKGDMSYADIGKTLIDESANIGATRGRTIAVTETHNIMSKANYDAMVEIGIEVRKWVTARDEKVRSLHTIMDGQTAKLGEPYSNGMMHPGDQSAPPEQTVNCRCIEVAV